MEEKKKMEKETDEYLATLKEGRDVAKKRAERLINKIMETKGWNHITDTSRWLTKNPKNLNFLNVFLAQRSFNIWPIIDRLIEDEEDLNIYFENPIKEENVAAIGRLKEDLEKSRRSALVYKEQYEQTKKTNEVLEREINNIRTMLQEKEKEMRQVYEANSNIMSEHNQLMRDHHSLMSQIMAFFNKVYLDKK